MATDLSYAEATGTLQSECVNAAIEISAIVSNARMEQWAKRHLLRVARTLRAASARVDEQMSSDDDHSEPEPSFDGGESASYRSAMRDAGRGHLLKG